VYGREQEREQERDNEREKVRDTVREMMERGRGRGARWYASETRLGWTMIHAIESYLLGKL
jgi:hypothetical protein